MRQAKVFYKGVLAGVISEGWLLEIAISNWKINPRDRFGLLLTMCADCIGCVSIQALKETV